MKKILVPTDFSINANKALDFAVQIARQAKAEIILVHTCDLIDTNFKDHLTLKKEHNQTIIDKANENLFYLKRKIEDTEKIFINIKLYNGTVTDTILQASEEHHADIIIMGSLSRDGLKEKIFGCKTADIIGKTNIPVIAVPIFSEWLIPKKILMTVNNFEEQPDISDLVFELAVLFNATVHIIMFNEGDPFRVNDLERKKTVSAYIEKLKASYKSTDIKYSFLYGLSFQETTEEYIHEQAIDIVVMVTHKLTFMESIFNGSMTKKMFYNTQIPLLVIPAVNKKASFKKTIENENKYSTASI